MSEISSRNYNTKYAFTWGRRADKNILPSFEKHMRTCVYCIIQVYFFYFTSNITLSACGRRRGNDTSLQWNNSTSLILCLGQEAVV